MSIKSVDAKTLKQWLDNNQAIVVDVRESAEYESERIEGSTLLSLSTVHKAALPDSHGKKLVLHCKLGKRSSTACQNLLAEDPSLELYNLEGGISAWMAAGYHILSSSKS